jgi:hypothetical protein
MPVSVAQVVDLYATNASIPREDEMELRQHLPALDDLPDPSAFVHMVSVSDRLGRTALNHRAHLWNEPIVPSSPETLLAVLGRATEAIRQLDGFDHWMLTVVEAGRRGGPRQDAWSLLLQQIRRTYRESQEATLDLVQYQPELGQSNDLDADATVVERIQEHVRGGGGFGKLALWGHGDWRAVLSRARIQRRGCSRRRRARAGGHWMPRDW